MANEDVAFTRSLLCLAMVIVIVGICTNSFKKMCVTYFVGLLAISAILLPDWEYYDRDISQWTRPVTVDGTSPTDVLKRGSTTRFWFYLMRTLIYGVVYSFGFYKWWNYVTQ